MQIALMLSHVQCFRALGAKQTAISCDCQMKENSEAGRHNRDTETDERKEKDKHQRAITGEGGRV